MFWVRTRFSDSEHVSPTQNTFLRTVSTKFSELGVTSFGKNFRSWELGVLEKRVLSENTFLWLRARFSDSQHVSPTQNTFLRNFRSWELGVLEKRVLSENTFLNDSQHVSPTQNTFLQNFRSWELGVLEKRVLSENSFLRLTARFPDSEHVSTKFSELGVRSFGKTCSPWEHVSPTQNTLFEIFGAGGYEFWKNSVRARFPDSEHVSTKFSELGVRSFGKTCSEWEHVSLTQSTFLRLRARFPDSEHVSTKFSELGVRSFGKTCSEWEHVSLTQSTFLRLTARFPDSEHVSTKFSELGVRSFGKTCSEWVSLTHWPRFSDSEHVSPTQNTFLRNFRSWELGVLEKRVLSENTFLRLRARFPDSEHVSPKLGVGS